MTDGEALLVENIMPVGVDDPDKIVGAWEVTKASEGTVPVGGTMEFTKDGKAKVTAKKDGTEITHEATYTIAGDKLTLTHKKGDEERKLALTIKKLTATELMLADEKDGKTVEFKRKK